MCHYAAAGRSVVSRDTRTQLVGPVAAPTVLTVGVLHSVKLTVSFGYKQKALLTLASCTPEVMMMSVDCGKLLCGAD